MTEFEKPEQAPKPDTQSIPPQNEIETVPDEHVGPVEPDVASDILPQEITDESGGEETAAAANDSVLGRFPTSHSASVPGSRRCHRDRLWFLPLARLRPAPRHAADAG